MVDIKGVWVSCYRGYRYWLMLISTGGGTSYLMIALLKNIECIDIIILLLLMEKHSIIFCFWWCTPTYGMYKSEWYLVQRWKWWWEHRQMLMTTIVEQCGKNLNIDKTYSIGIGGTSANWMNMMEISKSLIEDVISVKWCKSVISYFRKYCSRLLVEGNVQNNVLGEWKYYNR